jgi:DNA-binding protein H-NS
MPKVKPVTAMKQRLQESLSDLAEQEEVIELVRQAIEMYELKPMDVFSEDELGAALAPDPVDESIPYCDRAGNTWAGKGRRPTWLVEGVILFSVLFVALGGSGKPVSNSLSAKSAPGKLQMGSCRPRSSSHEADSVAIFFQAFLIF